MKKNLLESKLITDEQWQEYQNKKRQIEIMERYFELISDIGYDYDGCNSVESLKALVDELTHLASLGRACNDKEAIYSDGNNRKLNILLEEIKDEI